MNHIENFGRVVGYGLYTLGGSIPVGLARMVLSTAYIIKHVWIKKTVEEAQKKKQNAQIDEEVNDIRESRKAKEGVKKAKGFSENVKAGANLLKTKAKSTANKVGRAVDSTVSALPAETILIKERTLKDAWISEFARGAIECIPLIGGIYFAYQDYKGRKIEDLKNLQAFISGVQGKGPGFLGLNDVNSLMDLEDTLDIALR